MQQINLLVFPCGTEIALEIHRSLKSVPFINLFGASSVPDHGKFVFANYTEELPFITDEHFMEKLNQIIEKNNIQFIFPAYDSVGLFLSEHRENLKAELLISPHEAVDICRDKLKTYRFLEGEDFVPQYWTTPEEVRQYPVFIKPSVGQGSQGARKVENREELVRCLTERKEQQAICEYLEGAEYTVDCFTDRFKRLRYAAFRTRSRIRNGISVHSELLPMPDEVSLIAKRINELLPMRGVWFFQVKKDRRGRYKLMEIATRVAGTMCTERAVGVNLPLLTLYDAMEYDVEISRQFDGVQVDRALYNVFRLPGHFSEVYVDFDDTIILHEKVNCQLMRYLYQCVNENISLKLITKHDEEDIMDALKKYRIAPELFSEIITVKRTERKQDFIRPRPDALFLDDSFSERKDIERAFGITVLGTDSVEALIAHSQ